MKVVDIERVVILMRFIQFGWNEDRKKRFDDDLKMMLETQCEDLEEHDAKVRTDAIDEFANWLVEQGILGSRCVSDGEITDYGKVYAKKYKEQNK